MSTMSIATDAPATVPGRAAIQPRRPKSGGVRPLSAVRLRELVLSLFLLLWYGFFYQVPIWNEYSRYDLVRALVDDRTTVIDPYHENTGDKAFYGGHYYSTKPPGSSLLAAPTYALMRLVAGLTGSEPPSSRPMIHALAFTAAGVPTALLVLLMLRYLRPLVGEQWALAMCFGYAVGTIAFPFATMYFGHAASTFFLFAAFHLLSRGRGAAPSWQPLLAGLLAGWAVLTELPVALGVAVLLAYAAWLGQRQMLLFILGGLPLLATLLAYNWISFGHPFSIGYLHATVFGPQNSQGLVSVVFPSLSTARDLLFGARGLFTLSPWFLLVPLSLRAGLTGGLRAEFLVSVTMVAAFLTYNSGALNPFGGWTPGPRYLLPALPFATVLVALVPRLFRPLTAVLLAYSAVVTFAATVTMPNAPAQVQDPLSDLWLARILARDLGETTAWVRWGLSGLLPLWVLAVGALIAAAALYGASRSGSIGREVAQTGAVLLAVLVLAFSTPVDLTAAFRSGLGAESATSLVVRDAGATPGPRRDRPTQVTLWAQVENPGAAQRASVRFSIQSRSGEQAWSGSDVVDLEAGDRKRVSVSWPLAQAGLGDYQLSVWVPSADESTASRLDRQVSVLRLDEAGKVHVRSH
jgi:hypothetical protein